MPYLPKKNIQAPITHFIIEHTAQDKLARFIGVTFVIIIAISIIYIGSWQAAYAKQFYKVKFKINFLEGVQPGMKIRYQGGVIIGEIINIESNYQNHYLNAIIRNDFRIIKYGTKISLKEQGSFGGSYIDITTIPYFFSGEVYTSEDVIQISEIIPFQNTLNNFLKIFQSNTDEDSIIVNRLQDIRLMINKVVSSKEVLPSQLNQTLKNILSNASKVFYQVNDFNKNLYKRVDNLNTSLTKVANSLKVNLPIIRKKTNQIYLIVQYKPTKISENQFMHDEQLYYNFKLKLKHINSLVQNFKNYPYKLIFESGL
jgi:ABC-type transporter Mla subunit MlaD